MKYVKVLWIPITWFALAGYVIWRCTTSSQGSIDVIFAAWVGGVVSVFCVIVARRLVRQRREESHA